MYMYKMLNVKCVKRPLMVAPCVFYSWYLLDFACRHSAASEGWLLHTTSLYPKYSPSCIVMGLFLD